MLFSLFQHYSLIYASVLISSLFHSEFRIKPCIYFPCPPHVPHAPQFHDPLFDYPSHIWRGVLIVKQFFIQLFFQSPLSLLLLASSLISQYHLLKHSQSGFFPQCKRPSCTPIKEAGQCRVLHALIFSFFYSRLEDNLLFNSYLPTNVTDGTCSVSCINLLLCRRTLAIYI